MSDKFIPLSIPSITEEDKKKVQECLDSTFVSSVGPMVKEFEEKFADYVGSKYAVACSTGTAAIHLALLGLEIGAGDEVVVPDFTFIASVNPVAYVDANPILLDAEPYTLNPDTAYLSSLLKQAPELDTEMPDAIIGVHLYGMPMDLEEVIDDIDEYDIPLIEDATECLGSRWNSGKLKGKHVGTIGKVGCFSFNGNKIITAGAGGMVVTDDEGLAQRIKHISTQARPAGIEYYHDRIGYNYRMTNIHAALGLSQFNRLDRILEKKKEIARRYTEVFSKIPGIHIPSPPPGKDFISNNWLYTMVIDPERVPKTARDLLVRLSDRNIQARPLWTPMHKQPMYKNWPFFTVNNISDDLHQNGLNLPSSYCLTEEDQQRVIDEILYFLL
jgi:dTDP-4-amino-4,6-dideoxygalactose transaminase